MDGDRFIIGGRSWLTEIVEHWPRGFHEHGPRVCSVTFYDPEDPEEWVCNCRDPADAAELSRNGLSLILLDAGMRGRARTVS